MPGGGRQVGADCDSADSARPSISVPATPCGQSFTPDRRNEDHPDAINGPWQGSAGRWPRAQRRTDGLWMAVLAADDRNTAPAVDVLADLDALVEHGASRLPLLLARALVRLVRSRQALAGALADSSPIGATGTRQTSNNVREQ